MQKYFFILLLAILLINNTNTSSSSLKQFLQKQLKINLEQVDKLSLGQQGSQNNRFNVEIVQNRKTIKVVVEKNDQGQWNIVFMEKVSTFGNGKSFLNIKTSTGLRYENTVSVQQELPKIFAKPAQRPFSPISIPSFHIPLQSIKEFNLQIPTSILPTSNIDKIKKLIIQRFQETKPQAIQVVQTEKTNEWNVEAEIGGKMFKIKVKQLNENEAKMNERKEKFSQLQIVDMEQTSTIK